MAGDTWKSVQGGQGGGIAAGKGVEGACDTVMEEVGECVMYWIGKWWQRRKDLFCGELMDGGFWSPPLATPMNSWTQHVHYNYRIFLTD